MLVSSLITVLGLAFVVGILYHYFQGQLMGELKKEAVYISRGVESTGTDYLKKLNDEDSRITYVDESGKVIYDNEANVESMDNHGHRKEIREAEINGEGADERMSSTLSEKTMYYAVRLENGNVLRVSSNQASVWMLLLQLLPPFVAVLILMLLLSGVFASRLSGKVVEPLNGLDLEHPDENDAYDEVQPLLSKIGRQSRQIRLQLEAARRQQKEFSIITENMQEGLLVIDRYTMVLSVNSSVGKLLKVKEIKTGESVYLLNRSEEFRGVVGQVLEGKHENKILRLDGSEIQVIANPVTRENKTEGAVILLVDVTEKVEREQLRREFSANVSHELKTPLTSISGFAEIMQDGFVKDEDVKVFAGRIYKEAQRLIRLVGDVIRISRLDEGGLPYQWEKLDLYSLTHDIFSTLHEAAEKQEKAAELLAQKLEEKGCPKVVVCDLAREDMAEAVEDAFRYGKLVLASITYNGEAFPFMRTFIENLTERNYQNRTIGLIENGSWAPTAAKVMKGMFEKSKNITWLENNVKIMSSLSDENVAEIDAMAEELCK